jgi:hypothetical protein
MMETFAVVLVESTSQAMRVEHILHQAGLRCKLIPVPRMLSSNCGNCVRIEMADMVIARRVLTENGLMNVDVQTVQM